MSDLDTGINIGIALAEVDAALADVADQRRAVLSALRAAEKPDWPAARAAAKRLAASSGEVTGAVVRLAQHLQSSEIEHAVADGHGAGR